MRALIIVIALVISACASPPPVALSAANQGSVSGFATAAFWGSWEFETAPAYTRLAALRHRAARAYLAGRIDVATARIIQGEADLARTALDASHRGKSPEPTSQQRAQLADAVAAIERAERLLEN